jgi:hypothetical protein
MRHWLVCSSAQTVLHSTSAIIGFWPRVSIVMGPGPGRGLGSTGSVVGLGDLGVSWSSSSPPSRTSSLAADSSRSIGDFWPRVRRPSRRAALDRPGSR